MTRPNALGSSSSQEISRRSTHFPCRSHLYAAESHLGPCSHMTMTNSASLNESAAVWPKRCLCALETGRVPFSSFFWGGGICGVVFGYAGDAWDWFTRCRPKKSRSGHDNLGKQAGRMPSARDQWSFCCCRPHRRHCKATLGPFMNVEER